jgi:hypothetical protein
MSVPPQSSSSFQSPVEWHPAAPRPARGTAVAVTLPDGGAIWTTVTGTGGDDLTIALPPVLPAGTALELSWTDAPRTYRGTAVVLPTEAACLRLSLGSIRRVDRRGEARIAPNIPLAVHATVDTEPIHAAVRDVSPSGIAFWAEGSELPVGTELRLTLTLANGDVLAQDVPAEVVRVVRDAHGPATIGCACTEPAAMAPVLARV